MSNKYNQPLIDLEKRETVSRKEYDYQIQARAMGFRVFARALSCVEENHNHHIKYDDHGGYKGSVLEEYNLLTIRLLKATLGL